MSKEELIMKTKGIALSYESISLLRKKTLCIDCGDIYITIEHRGSFSGEEQFSWTTLSPSEGDAMGYESFLISKDQVKLRIDGLVSEFVPHHELQAIELFLTDTTLPKSNYTAGNPYRQRGIKKTK